MTTAAVKYISNGYIVVGADFPPSIPQPLYALTIPEVVYWLGRIFDPIVLQEPITRGTPPPPKIIVEPADPLLGQQAQVMTIASGGFLVTQLANPIAGGRNVEVFCTTMGAVSDALTQIFTPPAQRS